MSSCPLLLDFFLALGAKAAGEICAAGAAPVGG